MKTILPTLRLASLCLMATCSLHAYDALTRPTELQYWDSTRAQNGYTFFGVGGTSYLLDMMGRVVHSWPVGNNPHLQDDGSILDASTDDPSGFGGFKIVSWDGVTTWSYTESRSTYYPHHDFTRVFNKQLNAYTVLYIANKDLTYDQLIAAGANPATTPATGGQMDALVEVDSTGTVVWEWCFFDHLVQDYDATKSNYVGTVGTGTSIGTCPGRLNINLSGHSLKSDWLHCNSVDYNPTLDQIVVNSVQGEFYVIDHGNTFVLGDPTASKAKAATGTGDFLYRFGDPARYNQGGLSGNAAPTVLGSVPAVLEDWTQSTTGTKQMGGAHDIQWIPEGLTGAGHFLIFNNAEYLSEHTSQSYVFEINPYLNASGTDTGSYVNPPDAGYNAVAPLAVTDKATKLISKQVVLNYSTKSNLTIFSQIGCSAQRLPNGNTLVCADTEGYIQEVTPTGDCVWDYIVPVTPSGKVQTIGDRLPMINSIFRAYRYTASHPALVGRTLTGTTTITGRTTVDNPYAGTSNYQAMQRATETQYWDATNAANGYTFFGAQGISYLIDMAGRKVHTWPTGTDARLLDSGNVLDWATDTSGNTGLKELDWSGNTAWEYYETRSSYHPHGDFKRIYDPKLGAYATLYLANKDVTSAQCLAAGCDSADAPYVGAQIETIVEVDMSGNIIWEWSFWDHAIQNVDSSKANYGATIASYPGKIDLNLPGRPLQSNWLDCNSLDFNQSLNQIVVNSRQGEFYIIDHGNTFIAGNPSGSIALAATGAGDFLYRFGDPARYGQGTAPSVSLNWENAISGNKQIGASSNAQWINTGLSGAGHLLVFSNNQYLYQRTPQSYVFEINPFLNSSGVDTGSYVNPPTAGYTTWTFSKDTMKANQSLSSQVTWKYGSVGCHTLFSHFGSSVQRLSNGNTLICATATGYLVEVDTSGNVVWEYINPVTGSGVVTVIGDCLPMTNAVPRAMRFPASFAGFTGHTLTPGTTIAGKTVVVDELPSLANTIRTPATPTVSDAVWVTSTITDDGSVASAALTYTATSGTLTTTTPFTETFGTTASTGTNNWTGGTGTGTDTIWTVVAQPASFKLGTSSNYVNSSPAVGVQYNCSKAATATLTSSSINAAGTSGSVTFWVKTTGTMSGNDGWMFLLGSGSTYTQVTPSAGTANSNGFTPYTYNLDSSQLVNGLQLQFKFSGNGGTDTGRISLDQITVTVTTGSSSTATVAMLDDGAHGDGAAGDHVYGAQIPAQALGTVVSYYLTATDNSSQIAKDPAAAPTTTYSYTVAAANTAPTVATAAWATPNPATGTTTTLGALGADADTGESTLTYTWTATTLPSGATSPTFSANGSNAAKSTTATFSKAGTYGLTVTIADPGGLTATSLVSVTVAQTLTAIAVGPTTVNLAASATQQFAAVANDQFGNALTTQPGFTWASTVTGGSISSSGLFTAPATSATGTVTATSGAVSGNATVTVANTAPTVASAASATPSPVTGTTTALTALGADADTGESTLTYTWTATTVPSGATSPNFSANGSNAAKSTTATFSKAGTYGLTVTIADPGGLTATSSVNVTVAQTLTAIAVTPATASLNTAATQQFSAVASDQFGIALTTQPGFTWASTVTGGTINSSGLFTAPATPASGTVTATSGSVIGSASVTVTSQFHPYTMTALPDTGQVASYSTIFGEDADYTINPPIYKDNGDGTITDKVTGLMWQQTDGGEMTWEQAADYATSLSLGGHTDWRLAFAKELYSIMDQGTINPAINTTYFTATAADYWWSADVAVDDATKVWVTNAGGGIGPHPKTETLSAGGSKRFHVRCVRDPSASGATHLYGSLTNNGDGTVTDNHTGLTWQKAESATMTWENALVYAENLTLGGHSDWRLPNIKELQSISDGNLRAPSLDTTCFTGATTTFYWSSTSLANDTTQAWYLDCDYGLTTYAVKTGQWHVRCVRGGTATSWNTPALKPIPAGSFVMGDHFNFTDPDHPSDELPLHTVAINAFSMGTYDITNRQYCTYLNAALAQGLIEVRNGLVYAVGGTTIYCETREGESALFGIIYSGIEWDGTSFSVLANRDNHPMVGVRWEGAAAYCNWLSAIQGYQACYNLSTWVCDFAKSGYRLPTEAEWEYAANGGHTVPYYQFPWGSNTNTDGTWSNWENSGDPYETGDYPWTTPVGFYDGTLHAKSDFNWPGSQTTYQTSNAVNGYGLYDMGGNVWQWVNDWYSSGYYSVSPSSNPTGPTTGDLMPDGLPYRGMRGGTWYNGAQYLGLSRISNRDPGYYRGPQDPNHPYYHVGFRVALKSGSLVQAGATTTQVVSNLQFGEGATADASGNVFFSDITANTIYKWSTAGVLTTFRTGSGGANGLAFDSSGNLIACEGTNGRIVSITPAGVVTVIAAQYNGKRFNEPNDLWIAPNGGIYFTDPVFFGTQVQDAQAVYYINPARTTVTRVISDMVQPNGLIGTSDGTTLYVSDYGAGATYKYTVNSDGSLTGKTLFVAVGSDGMEIDSNGNIYLTSSDVLVYSSAGTLLQTINVPNRPTNLCFAGTDRRTLFITTETAMYSIAVVSQGLAVTVANAAPVIALTTCTPTAPTPSDAPWITSRITDDTSVASATLTYSTGSGTATTTTVFTETMASTAIKPWTGGGAVNGWSVTGSSYIEQRLGSNYGTGNACGMEYKAGPTTNALTAAMINTTSSINAAGASGYVEFWLQSLTLTGTAGWTFQLDPTGTGSSYVTRLSELTGNSHGWQKYHYDLTSGELASTLKMRFQFTGGGAGTDHRIDLDQITVVVTSAGGITSTTVTMLDDGLHGDGTAGDGIYGGQIPAKPVGTTVSYYLTATDGAGLATTSGTLSYTVGNANHAPTVATAAAATPATVTGTTTALSALGADADTAESTLTYTWAATTLPSGATAPGLSANGSNAAKSTTASFSQAGTYGFTVTIADPGGLTVATAVSVTVSQTLSSIAVTPASASVNAGATQQFSAAANDQFGNAMAIPPTFTWTTTVTGGAISSSGLFTASGTAASGTVTATSGAVSGNATVASVAAEPTMGLFLNTSGAYNGYTLMAPMHSTKTYLLNNAGEVVHRWSSTYEPGRSAYLLENGHMIRACMILSGGPSTGGGEGGRIEEYDWDGNMVWAFDYYSTSYIAHHDFKVLPNGNVLVLAAEKKTYAEAIAAGFNPAQLDPSIASAGYMLPDYLVEVTPTKPYGGTVVWQWHIWDHAIQDFSSAKNNYGVVTNHPELIDVNGTGMMIPQFWNHVNGIDYNPDLDQIMLSIRNNSELFVIDHQTTTAQAASHAGGRYNKGGDILYRWGNPQQYDRGTNANQQLFQQHHTHWIPTGCPGAGNILIFNNGLGRGYSTVNQIVPPVDSAGDYTITSGTAFGPSTPVWTYQGTPATDFYSSEISGCQRLPNGNTLICEGVKGNLFEVTSAGACVWQYLCPVTDSPLTQGGSIPVDPGHADQYMNAVFRVYRYGTTYAGLLGRDLTSQGTIELPLNQTLRMASVTRTSGATSGSSPMAMSWVSLPDKAYQVQFSTSLTTGTWTTIATVQSIGTLMTFTDTDSTRLGQQKGFYRVALAP